MSTREPVPSAEGDERASERPSSDERLDWRCYRHPDRDAGVKCRRCERPICPEDMITAPVGFQCPSCVKAAPAVRSLRSLRVVPYLTYTLIGASILAFLAGAADGSSALAARGGNPLANDFGLFGPAVAAGEWWRLVTSAFLHFGPLHLGFNMFATYWLGSMLEPALGRARFGALYVTALLGGALGVLVLDPGSVTAGASGAVYGLMGAAVVMQRKRGVDPMQSGLGGLLVINLLFTFLVPGISIGGHLGGLVAGALAGSVLGATEGRDAVQRWLGLAALVGISAVFVFWSLLLAKDPLGI